MHNTNFSLIVLLDIRAERRAKEFGFKKNSLDYHKIYNSLDNRDHSDMYRKLHPLKFVPQLGVRKIDNSTELDKTLEKIYKLIE
jgi:cytidylate kinase